ncbi:MAG TPA: YCF48-related protein [Pyrinomonadaceae bacterium]|nr:YCF48-related protein [Pyrinomonadaceae bacterium]
MNKVYRRVSGFVAVGALFITLLSNFAAGTFAGGTGITDKNKFSTWTVLGPSGGDVRAIEVDPKNKDRVYITTLDGQIYVSSNAGASWQLLASLDRPELVLDQLMIDPRDSNIIYASGHRQKDPGGFFKTSDGGKTWKESKELRSESIHSMTQSDKDPNILLVGALDGVWISKDSGDSWEKISSATMPVNVDSLVIDPRNTSTFYAGTWWRAYKSTDSGQSWRLIKDGMIDDSDVFAVTIDPRDAGHLVASACSGIYESQNGGERWAKMNGIPSDSRRTYAIVQHPTIPGTIYAATNQGFWMSTNGGKSWMMTTSRDLMVTSIAVSPEAPNRIFIGTSNFGVMISDDGGKNWRQSNQNFTSRFTYAINADIERPNRLYALTRNVGGSSGGSFFTSDDGGNSWIASNNLDINRVAPFAMLQDRTDPNIIYLGTNVGVFRSPDRGVTWMQFTPPKPKPIRKSVARKPVASAKGTAVAKPKPTPPPDPNAPVIVPALTDTVKVLAFTEDGKNGILAGTDSGLFRTYDITKGWEKIKLGDGSNDNIFAIHISPKRPNQIWVGTAASGVLVSNDDGSTWQQTSGAPKDVPISSITTDPKRPDYVYVGTWQAFYLSRDGGQTWVRRGGNLPLGNYTSILINPQNTDEIFISSALGSDGGVFYSSDAGMKWKRVDSKDMAIPSRRVWSMVFDPHDSNRIFAGTHSAGVYRIDRLSDSAKSDDAAKSDKVAGN